MIVAVPRWVIVAVPRWVAVAVIRCVTVAMPRCVVVAIPRCVTVAMSRCVKVTVPVPQDLELLLFLDGIELGPGLRLFVCLPTSLSTLVSAYLPICLPTNLLMCVAGEIAQFDGNKLHRFGVVEDSVDHSLFCTTVGAVDREKTEVVLGA